MKTSHLLSASALASMLILAPSAAFAQDTPAPDTQEETVQDEGTILVTGSRIRRPNLESTVPITSIAGE